ncbi:metallophosphoesterase [uncultured Helicobacter sp.]|uniref:metallophosphoesterase n=1 Tax=uncultured Helicobacter sp. TaxID=175537 RepID=UPI00374F88A6
MMKLWLVVGVIFIVLALMKVYAYYRFLCHSFVFRNHRITLVFLLCALYAGELAFFFLAKDRGFDHHTYIALGSCVIVSYGLFLACIIGDVSRSVGRATLRGAMARFDLEVLDSQRRRFLKIVLDLGILALFVFFSTKSIKNALAIPKVREVEVELEGLETPKNIAMISDVHIGKMIQSEFVQGMVDTINALNADVVVIVGDLVDENIAFVKEFLRPLNELRSREGVYYVSGNHEYYHGIESISAFLKTLNLKVLENENIELESFNLAGVNDLAGLRFGILPPDLRGAQSGLNPQKPSILLAHQPKFVRQNDVSAFDLVLCGHTHAGQVFPLSIFVWLDQHYIHGLYKLDSKTQLYVSSGVGFWGPAMRFLAPSEIVNLKLKPKTKT